jgi:hypothetical protein
VLALATALAVFIARLPVSFLPLLVSPFVKMNSPLPLIHVPPDPPSGSDSYLGFWRLPGDWKGWAPKLWTSYSKPPGPSAFETTKDMLPEREVCPWDTGSVVTQAAFATGVFTGSLEGYSAP